MLKTKINKRIIGIDVARSIAIIGMIIVNFKLAFGEKGHSLMVQFSHLLEGKVAATFVVLAGIGMAFMTNTAILTNDIQKLKKTKLKIVKRALLLFIIGLLYLPIWEADILHYYGIYMLFSLLWLTKSAKTILISSFLIIFSYPILMLIWDFDYGWNFELLTYLDFWTINGFLRNLFYNGFHPVIPWTAFMLIGLWFGKQNLNDTTFIKKSLLISLSIFIITQLISCYLISYFTGNSLTNTNELNQILGTSPMPPLPIYMISGSSISICVISICILLAKKYENTFIINALSKTGQLALTFYVAHVIIGMGIVEVINPTKMGNYTINFSLIYALAFSFLCILFAVIWTKKGKIGPLEWLMRKIIA